jgi:hypothetical protein
MPTPKYQIQSASFYVFTILFNYSSKNFNSKVLLSTPWLL